MTTQNKTTTQVAVSTIVRKLPFVREFEGVRNQYTLFFKGHTFFQSYQTIIAYRDPKGNLFFDRAYNGSATTTKYLNRWTGLTSKETKKRIEDGDIQIVDLNSRDE